MDGEGSELGNGVFQAEQKSFYFFLHCSAHKYIPQYHGKDGFGAHNDYYELGLVAL